MLQLEIFQTISVQILQIQLLRERNYLYQDNKDDGIE